MNITDLFIDEILAISEKEIPDRVTHQIKRCLIDYTGVTFAGARIKEMEFEKYLQAHSEGGSCPIIGLNLKSDFSTASILNGFASHVLELDDGHRYGMLHLEAPIISALLTIAKKDNINILQFMKGIVVGYEAAVRLAIAIQPMHKKKGFHATGTCGTIGVACAIAIALGYNRKQLKSTISNAATSASGLLEVIDDASEIKPYNVSMAVLNGITAAYFGRLELAGPNDVLGGTRGFLKTLTGTFDKEALYQDSEGKYQIEKIYVKPYAACRHAHAAIEGVLLINNRERFSLEEIDKIEVETYKLAVLGHDHSRIEGISSAKMSIPYGVAVSILLNEAGIEAFKEDIVCREDILNLCKKVRVSENEKLTSLSPGKRGALVKIYTSGGEIFEQLIENPLGEPENNISDKDLEQKYATLMKYSGKSKEDTKKILEIVWSIDKNYDKFLNLI